MAERLGPIPIQEPNLYPPIFDPIVETSVIGDPPFNQDAIEFALNTKQREWVKKRDGQRCQATVKHKCNQEDGIEVDHIMPQRYAYNLGIDPDFPENCLSKCKNAHNIKHPDRIAALQTYHQAKSIGINTFEELSQARNSLLENRQIYWNDANDRTDAVRAIQLTQRFKAKGEVWPQSKNKL